jgi:tetratricopeptide (TPR) repeat protein
MIKRVYLWKSMILIFLAFLLFNGCTKKPYEIHIDEVEKKVSNKIVEPSYQEITVVEDEDIVSFLLANALELIKSSTDEWDKPKELSKIAMAYKETGQEDKAFEILNHATEEAKKIYVIDIRSDALKEIVIAYIKIGGYKEALNIIKNKEMCNDLIITAGAIALAETGKIKLSQELTDKILDVFLKMEALSKLAISYTEAGQKEKALEILSESIKLIEKMDAEIDKAEELYSQNPSNYKYPPSSPIKTAKAKALSEIALAYEKTGEKEKYQDFISQSIKLAEKIVDEANFFKKEALLEISSNCLEGGKYEEAYEIIKKMKAELEQGWKKIEILSNIAIGYTKIGEKEKGLEILNKILIEAEKASNEWLLAKIASSYAEVGQYEKAFEIVKKIDNKFEKVFALSQIAKNYIEIDQNDKALKILDQAFEIAKKIESEYYKAWVFREIAINYAKIVRN